MVVGWRQGAGFPTVLWGGLVLGKEHGGGPLEEKVGASASWSGRRWEYGGFILFIRTRIMDDFLFLVSPENAPACTFRAVDIIMYSPYDLSHIKYGLYQPREHQLRTKGWHWPSWPQQSGSQLGGCTGCRPWRNQPRFPSLLCHG